MLINRVSTDQLSIYEMQLCESNLYSNDLLV